MSILKSIWNLIVKIRDIGVPEDMPPEEAKYISATNIIIALFIPALIIFSFITFVNGMTMQFCMNMIGIPICLFAIYLNKIGRHTLARVFSIVAFIFVEVILTVLKVKGDIQYYIFAPISIVIILAFSKRETKVMYALLAFNLFCLAAALFARNYFEPSFKFDPIASAVDNRIIKVPIFVSLLLIGLITRSTIFRAEKRTQEQKERTQEEKDKFYRLAEKLKAYLPHQLVNKLVSDDSDPGPDYSRKHLTIFFSDVQGFTKWTDKLEPEEVRELLNQYLSDMSNIANKWGGTIDKFIGDCLMIFFGDPEYTNDKDHAIRCVKMAIEMQKKLDELRNEWRHKAYDEPLHIRIGINTGWATVGNFGSHDRLNYTALGGEVNLASRIESLSAPDKITVSHTTYQLIEDEIKCEYKGEIEVKGFSEPVKLYEVVGVKS